MKKMFASMGVALVMLSGCGDNAPTCSDDSVKDLVIDISTDALRDQVMRTYFGGHLSSYAQAAEMWNNRKDDNSEIMSIREVMELAEKSTEDMELTATRMSNTDEKLRKTECRGQLNFNSGKSSNVTYNAQYTDDDDLYVEVIAFR